MKLKTLLEYLDPLTDIVIWSNFEAGTPEYSEEPEFKGCVMDCPQSLANCKLIKAGAAKDGYDGIRTSYETDEYDFTIPLLNVKLDMKGDH